MVSDFKIYFARGGRVKRHFFIPLILSILASVLVFSCRTLATPVAQTPQAYASTETLRNLAQQQGLAIGSAVRPGALRNEPAYQDVLAHQFNIVMPEHDMKFEPLHPEPDVYDFAEADEIVAFAKAHNMKVIGHALVWFHVLPRWVREGNFNREELIAILRDHIYTVVSHYRGEIYAWDVVNEPLEADGSLRDTIWLKGIGPEYIDLAIKWAHEADPDALLYINDYGEGINSKSDSFYSLAKSLVERGLPLNAVGFQTHIGFLSADNPQEVADNMKRYAALGLEVFITEMDVPVSKFSGTREEQLAAQAKTYGDFLKVCLEASNCDTFLMWGFTDRHSWLTGFTGGKAPLIFDEAYRPKPAYYTMLEELKQNLQRGSQHSGVRASVQ